MLGTLFWAIVSASPVVAQRFTVIDRNSSTFLGSQSSGTLRYYSVHIPTGAADLRVNTTGTGGDVDLILYNPAGSITCSRASSSVNEECYISSPSAGYWDIRVRYYSNSYDVYLTLRSNGGVEGNVIELNGLQTIDSLSQGDQALFTVQASSDLSAIRIGTRGGSGDVDLFVGEGSVPTPYQSYDCDSQTVGSNVETCLFEEPSGYYYLSVYAYEAAGDVEVYVDALGPPDAPVATEAVALDLGAEVYFDAPSDNGDPVSSYAATCQLVDTLSDQGFSSSGTAASVRDEATWRLERVPESSRPSRIETPVDGVLIGGPPAKSGTIIPERLQLDLPEGELALNVLAARVTPSDNVFLTGKSLDGDDFSILITPEGTAIGKVVLGGDILLLSPTQEPGLSVLRSVADAGLAPMPLGEDFVVPQSSAEDVPFLEAVENTSTSTIDVMMLYDPNLGLASADYALQVMNDIHARSGTGVTFVATSFREYSASSDPLSEIANSSQISGWRDADRADLVAWIGKFFRSYGYCGVAYAPGSNNTSFSGNIKAYGFSVTLVGTDSGAYCTDEVLAHEIGHNLGNIHDLANSGSSTPYRPYGYGDGISGVFGTVQSYLSPEQGKFSSPNLSCAGGYACGRYSYTNVVRAIDDVRSIVAEVYSGTSGGGGAGEVFTVTPSAGFGGSVSPSSPQSGTDGGTLNFTFSPDPGYEVTSISSTCVGVLEGSTYTVTLDGADCSFEGRFEPSGRYYSVSVSSNSGGAVSPLGVTRVTPFDVLPVSVQPAPGFSVTGIADTCDGAYSSGTYTSGEITRNCAVDIQFARSGAVASRGRSPVMVLGLTEGAEYTCTVTATNSYGESPPSNSVTVTPFLGATPGAPRIDRILSEDGELVIIFTAGSTGNLPTTYTATCGDQTAASDSSPITVSGLSNNVPVTCTVTATNSRGSTVSSGLSGTPEAQASGLPVWLLYQATQP